MGSAAAEGESRATKAVSQALASPLLNDNDITGANYILLNITSGDEEVSMDEIDEISKLYCSFEKSEIYRNPSLMRMQIGNVSEYYVRINLTFVDTNIKYTM